jgi:hypothetical protein
LNLKLMSSSIPPTSVLNNVPMISIEMVPTDTDEVLIKHFSFFVGYILESSLT